MFKVKTFGVMIIIYMLHFYSKVSALARLGAENSWDTILIEINMSRQSILGIVAVFAILIGTYEWNRSFGSAFVYRYRGMWRAQLNHMKNVSANVLIFFAVVYLLEYAYSIFAGIETGIKEISLGILVLLFEYLWVMILVQIEMLIHLVTANKKVAIVLGIVGCIVIAFAPGIIPGNTVNWYSVRECWKMAMDMLAFLLEAGRLLLCNLVLVLMNGVVLCQKDIGV